ncbi:MAG TPA: sulfatase-like hydrolase/transferase, partial [Bacteroidales bacterium]|nr:sulfatase-like hydrolase/transferase [Bacteroidales bacterium]
MLKEQLKRYSIFYLLNFLLIFIARGIEFILLQLYHAPSQSAKLTLAGFIGDIFLFTLVLTVVFPLYFILQKRSRALADRFFLLLTSVFWSFHFLILSYYIIELKMLDSFLFQYSWKEIVFTIGTAETNQALWVALAVLPFIVTYFINKIIPPLNFNFRYVVIFLLICVPGLWLCRVYAQKHDQLKISTNKSVYFYTQSIKFLFVEKTTTSFDVRLINEYQKEYNNIRYLSREYPLLHKAAQSSPLCNYFVSTGRAPSIIILIVEGLNNRFVNEIYGVPFMPFLDSLKSQSLYWDHFLTNGERSFAVVPTLTGSLPYGEKGFTLLEQLPIHLNLVKVMNANNYFTSFFYGQGAWMHQKDRYFKMSDIDLIVDKEKFASKYKKIVTGNDQFFWGYNDKQLFDEYKEVSDTLPSEHRLDIFFTGSMHPPFAISNDD